MAHRQKVKKARIEARSNEETLAPTVTGNERNIESTDADLQEEVCE